MYTQAQKDLLRLNPNFHVLDEQHDGDLLIANLVPTPDSGRSLPELMALPYILAKSGKVQGIAYHYRYYHNQCIPAFHSGDSPPSDNGPSYLTRQN